MCTFHFLFLQIRLVNAFSPIIHRNDEDFINCNSFQTTESRFSFISFRIHVKYEYIKLFQTEKALAILAPVPCAHRDNFINLSPQALFLLFFIHEFTLTAQ